MSCAGFQPACARAPKICAARNSATVPEAASLAPRTHASRWLPASTSKSLLPSKRAITLCSTTGRGGAWTSNSTVAVAARASNSRPSLAEMGMHGMRDSVRSNASPVRRSVVSRGAPDAPCGVDGSPGLRPIGVTEPRSASWAGFHWPKGHGVPRSKPSRAGSFHNSTPTQPCSAARSTLTPRYAPP